VSLDDGEEGKLWENEFLQEEYVSLLYFEQQTMQKAELRIVEILIIKSDSPASTQSRFNRSTIPCSYFPTAKGPDTCAHQVRSIERNWSSPSCIYPSSSFKPFHPLLPISAFFLAAIDASRYQLHTDIPS
jgi:hypothetical protein